MKNDFLQFVMDVAKNYRLDINVIDRDADPARPGYDGKTLLDYIRDEVSRMRTSGGTGQQVTDLEKTLVMLRRDYGAKYASELQTRAPR